ncbi:hypothetical protein DMENIID0001_078950 [Sergentomyia squamirostris]
MIQYPAFLLFSGEDMMLWVVRCKLPVWEYSATDVTRTIPSDVVLFGGSSARAFVNESCRPSRGCQSRPSLLSSAPLSESAQSSPQHMEGYFSYSTEYARQSHHHHMSKSLQW